MINFKEAYLNDIKGQNMEYYRITVTDFIAWIDSHEDEKKHFNRKLTYAETDTDLYEIAYDYSIPVTMVKFFRKRLV